MDGIPSTSPRVDALIERVMEQHPGVSASAQARYYEEVHQELAPLARDLERENDRLRALVAHLAVPVGWKLVPVRPTPEMVEVICDCYSAGSWPEDYGPTAATIRRECARDGYRAVLEVAPLPHND